MRIKKMETKKTKESYLYSLMDIIYDTQTLIMDLKQEDYPEISVLVWRRLYCEMLYITGLAQTVLLIYDLTLDSKGIKKKLETKEMNKAMNFWFENNDTRSKLLNRLHNWKFKSALKYLEGSPEKDQKTVIELAENYGNIGWILGDAKIKDTIDAELQKIDGYEEPSLLGIRV